jgi:two-component system, cell cycle sensor histidine kinase and response regulator CckA
VTIPPRSFVLPRPRFPVAIGLTAVAVGLAVVAGWHLDVLALKQVFPELPAMRPNTAVGLVAVGVALLLLRAEPVSRADRAWVVLLAAGAAGIGVTTLVEYGTGTDLGFDPMFVGEVGAAARPGFPSALSLALLGSALLLIDARPRRFPELANVLALLAILIALLALIGYACDVPSFYGVRSYAPHAGMAVHSAVLVAALGTGVIAARPARGLMALVRSRGPDGVVSRRLLLAPVVLPLAVGLLQVRGIRAGVFSPELGAWLFSLANIAVFTVTIWWVAGVLRRADAARTRALEALAEADQRLATASQERTRRILDSANDPFVATDAAGRIIDWNARAEETFGWTRTEAFGRPLAGTIFPDGKCPPPGPGGFPGFDGAVVDRRTEVVVVRRDGREFPVEMTVWPVEVAGVMEYTAFLHDVSERRRLEGQLRQAQKMEAVGQLAAGVAHDFNNLLTVINGYADLLVESTPPDDPVRDLAGEIRRAGDRSAGLTRQLLTFSRQQVIAPRVLDLNRVVGDTDKMLARVIGEDVRLTTVLAPGLWPVKADPGQVEQVLMNLCVNARDAMPTGGRLTVETQNVVLDEAYAATQSDARPGPHVLLAVSDTGQGMSPEVMGKAFEPFFTTKGVGRGTGLGLATVYGIVRQAGGHVGVYSEVGVGTTFKAYFPRAETTPGEGRPDRDTAPGRGTETVLVVEDDAAVRALTRRVLTGHGYTVLEAADGDEAARIADAHGGPVHLLVTDVVMPGAGGRVVAEDLARRLPGLRVLFMSGYTDDAVVRHGVLHDRVHFLQKPFTGPTLAAKVRAVLDGPANG